MGQLLVGVAMGPQRVKLRRQACGAVTGVWDRRVLREAQGHVYLHCVMP